MATLLDGWHGAAATAFAEAWSDWLDPRQTVESALSGLADSLNLFQTDVTQVDDRLGRVALVLAGRLS